MQSGPHLRVTGLTKHFGGVPAVEDVSIEIARGELFAVLGPSGCGKSTLLRMLAGFETPDGGKIQLDGQDLTAVPPHRRPVNMMFQSYALFPHMSVERNVAYGLRQEKLTRPEIHERVRGALAMVQLADLGARRPDQLSGGQRQRVALARALVKRPKLLLLDEPLAALDRKLREQTRSELKRLQKALGTTFVIVTHDQEEAMSIADRIAVMNEGRVVQVGAPRDVYESPTNRFVAGFIGDVNLLEARVSTTNASRVTSDIGEIRIARPIGASFGDTVWVAIRPERLDISRTPPETDVDHIAGTVCEVGYLGDMSLYRVRTPEGRVLTVVAPNRSRALQAPIREGERVHLSWLPDAAAPLPP